MFPRFELHTYMIQVNFSAFLKVKKILRWFAHLHSMQELPCGVKFLQKCGMKKIKRAKRVTEQRPSESARFIRTSDHVNNICQKCYYILNTLSCLATHKNIFCIYSNDENKKDSGVPCSLGSRKVLADIVSVSVIKSVCCPLSLFSDLIFCKVQLFRLKDYAWH